MGLESTATASEDGRMPESAKGEIFFKRAMSGGLA
jgi:hypothetical protein